MVVMSRRSALGVMTGAAVSACARAARNVTWWALGLTGENAPLLLPSILRATGIAVDVQTVPWTGAHEKLLSGFAGNSLPDIMMLNCDWLPELALIGALAKPPQDAALFADQFPGARAAVNVDGCAVAIPWTADSWLQFYRRDLVGEVGYAAPPLVWSEWMRMARSIKRLHPDRYATLHLLDWPEPLFNFAVQQEVQFLRDHDTRGNFSSAAFRAALAFYKSIFDEQLAPLVTGTEVGDTYLALRRGLFAIFPSNAVTIGDLRIRTAIVPPEQWSVALTPGFAGAGKAMLRGTCLAVSHQARDPARAWRVVRYLCEAGTQRRLYKITGDLPTRPSAWTDHALIDDPVATAFARQIAHSAAIPAVPEWQRIVNEVQLVAEHMVRGEYGVDIAAAKMDERVDRILAKRRWLLDRGRIA